MILHTGKAFRVRVPMTMTEVQSPSPRNEGD